MKIKAIIPVLLFVAVIFACERYKLPTVTTGTITEITDTSALGHGYVVSDGGAMVAVKGVCWKKTPKVNVYDSATVVGNDTGKIVSRMRWLTPGTTYYMRAFASNSAGTGYGEEISFTTTSTGKK
jgi:collagen type VII alpha